MWSLGHRNVQGLAFDSTGRLWASEFGQDTWDELNLIRKGGNYGWPVVEGKARPVAAYIDPLVVWHPDNASPSGLAIVDDVAYVACLRGNRLWQVPLVGAHRGDPKALFTGTYGRLRTVVLTPDGDLWVTTSQPRRPRLARPERTTGSCGSPCPERRRAQTVAARTHSTSGRCLATWFQDSPSSALA